MIIQQGWIDAAQAVHKALYPKGPFASCQLAQFGDESAWGKDASGVNNYFGIKATKVQIAAGQARSRMTWEDIDGKWEHIPQYFANYSSLTDGFLAHGILLCQPWYEDCINAVTPEEYCEALQKDHYATAPNYAEALIEIINSFNLKQYDLTMT